MRQFEQSPLERFVAEQAALQTLPAMRFDTSYRDLRQVAWDGYIEVRGNRYSVPEAYCGQGVSLRINLDGGLRVYDKHDTLIAEHRLQNILMAGKPHRPTTSHCGSRWVCNSAI